ncbi:uncharacterized protein JCM15063_000707 [Sporobolomyces koalae]|uniref:uncharacterized protein n=1 Tax=Sporobolomyces koalae TaxID=500713 RepID=UPI00317B1A50
MVSVGAGEDVRAKEMKRESCARGSGFDDTDSTSISVHAGMSDGSLGKLVVNLVWISCSAFHYGYHIAALNAASDAVIASIELSTFQFGIVTSAYTVGGLAASLYAGALIARWGQKETAVRAAWATLLGSAFVTLANSFWVLTLGRVIIGFACGIATVVVPLYLQSVSPAAIAGKIGILCQIAINVGILTAQGISIPFSTPGTNDWRKISFISIVTAALQIGFSWVASSPSPQRSSSTIYDVPASSDEDEERAPFVTPSPTSSSPVAPKSMTVQEVLRSKDPSISGPLKALTAIMLFQQFSGINAVMFYSVKILTAVNPASAKKTALFVTVVNLVMTFPAVYLVDKLGRKTLLLVSLATMSLSSLVLGYSINHDRLFVASVGIMAFVVSFAMGLGPIPFVLLGELPKEEAKSATASVAVGTNWISNLAIGVFFLPLRDWLASLTAGSLSTLSTSTAAGSGSVFYVFTAVSAVGVIVVGRLLP